MGSNPTSSAKKPLISAVVWRKSAKSEDPLGGLDRGYLAGYRARGKLNSGPKNPLKQRAFGGEFTRLLGRVVGDLP